MNPSPHFTLEEFLPPGMTEANVPADVLANLTRLCADILEPVRAKFGLPVRVTSGWRPFAYNAAIGGAKGSDHVHGRAADIRVMDGNNKPWELNTLEAFDYIRIALAGKYGQLILEDHRVRLANPGKFWIHVAIPSAKHPGDGTDPLAVLLSTAPKTYEPWKEDVT